MTQPKVRIPVKFTDVYDGVEHERVAYVDVTVPDQDADIEEWADDQIRPHTGDGNAVDKDAGYFAEIVSFHARPDLVGREFEWGV
ncbi:hypothetical protein SEA_VANLEE_138 [Gordonia phage VanLee]|uniref:Uncharacterized protein n=1 Tax=Gordonia phage VanLee TaxID=2845816 RepID=A0A8F2DAC6_9CAUD|nr:hypothetical protein QEH49_gp152 [Gordonia phage VanLee]QWS68254.1 hypothetical protein SEA_VANLEE_138 [Gordonia phage VanLee]